MGISGAHQAVAILPPRFGDSCPVRAVDTEPGAEVETGGTGQAVAGDARNAGETEGGWFTVWRLSESRISAETSCNLPDEPTYPRKPPTGVAQPSAEGQRRYDTYKREAFGRGCDEYDGASWAWSNPVPKPEQPQPISESWFFDPYRGWWRE